MLRRLSKTTTALSIVFLALAAVAVVLAFERQALFDWLALRDYSPPPAIASLASQDTMTSYARHVFYVNHPVLDDKTSFYKPCPNDGGEQTIVLGCYHSDQAGIFVLSVTDPRLNGVEQVTAAHEMLHAAYGRLSSSERAKVDAMLLDYYNHDLHDPRILTTIAAYKKSEPNDVVNEMHSVFGTEVANLPPGLEAYYKRYFTNRSQIAQYAGQYQAEFTSRQATVKADDQTLTNLKAQIGSEETNLKAEQSQILNLQSQLNSEKATDSNAYNLAVPSFNAQIDSYNLQVTQTQTLINQYNQLVASRNAVALEEDELVNDLSPNTGAINN